MEGIFYPRGNATQRDRDEKIVFIIDENKQAGVRLARQAGSSRKIAEETFNAIDICLSSSASTFAKGNEPNGNKNPFVVITKQ